MPKQRKPLGRLIGAFKAVSTKRVKDLGDTPASQLWQRNYHERVIGVNNRDLRDFTVDLGTFERLAPRLAGATLVAESGVKSPEDARRLRDAGADAVLVGEAAMRDPGLVSRLAFLP